MILHKHGPVWSYTSCAGLMPLASAPGPPAARARARICCARQSLLPTPACQPWLVTTVYDSLTMAVPAASQPPEKMTAPVASWSCARCPILWMEVPDGSCPAIHPDVPLAYVDVEKPATPGCFPVPLLTLSSSESSTGRKDSDGNFPSLSYQGCQTEKESYTIYSVQNLQKRPLSDLVLRHFLKTKYCSESSSRALIKISILTRNKLHSWFFSRCWVFSWFPHPSLVLHVQLPKVGVPSAVWHASLPMQ